MASKTGASQDGFQDVPEMNDEWKDVDSEVLIKFDTIGDVLIGRFVGWTESETGIAQAHFETPDHGLCFVNCGWDLKTKLRQAKKGTLYRMELTDLQDTGHKSPMMVFKVQFKK